MKPWVKLHRRATKVREEGGGGRDLLSTVREVQTHDAVVGLEQSSVHLKVGR